MRTRHALYEDLFDELVWVDSDTEAQDLVRNPDIFDEDRDNARGLHAVVRDTEWSFLVHLGREGWELFAIEGDTKFLKRKE